MGADTRRCAETRAEMDQDTLYKIIRVLLFTETDDGYGAPVMLWGPPGVGKTKMISQIAADYAFPLRILSPGLHGMGAFGVVPVPIGSGTATRLMYPRPAWCDELEDAGDVGIVFVDEITTAPPALQPPLLGLIQSKYVGDTYLGRGVRVIAAGNPPNMAAGGWDLSLPVANRMCHFDWSVPTAQRWGDYMLGASRSSLRSNAPKYNHADIEATVARGWMAAYSAAASVVTSFIRARPQMLHSMPTNASDVRAWPSHRSWTLAVQAMATATALGDTDVLDDIARGFVGDAAATEFAAYRAALDLPDPRALLDGTVVFVHDYMRMDRTMAVLAACATYVSMESKEHGVDHALHKKHITAVWKLIQPLANDTPDVVIPAAQVLCSAKLTNVPTASAVLVKMRPILSAAGYQL